MPRYSHLSDEFEIVDVLRELSQAPLGRLSFHELADRCAVPPRKRPRFRRFLKRLLRERIVRVAKGRGYRLGSAPLPEEEWAVTGIVRRHRDGFGFLVREDDDDLFLANREMREIFDGDRVRAVPMPGRFGRLSGRVLEIVERARSTITGSFRKIGVRQFVWPDPELFGEPIELVPGAVEPRDGEIVEVEIRDWPHGGHAAVGRITEIIGAPGELGTLIETVIRRHALPRRFPDAALEQAESLPRAPSEEEIAGRVDLREEPTFTIDGEDARDFDDAVSVQELDDGRLRLKVSIADVAHYVPRGTPLDREAYERSASAYFPDRVIPMLPERLSNGIASLKPGENRLTLTVEMDFDEKGRRTHARLYESAIRSAHRWTYTGVARALAGESVPEVDPWRDDVRRMAKLMERLRARREERGSIDFDLPEPDVILDATGRPEEILRAERNDAHRIIEEFMIAANETVADWFVTKWRRQSVFRIHAPPDLEKMRAFVDFARAYGHVPDFGALASSGAIAAFLREVRGAPAERALNHILLRSLMRAEYSAENSGHFGLASERYLHFTSPIRRYPDLIVHRLTKAALRRDPPPEDRASLERIAAKSSQGELAIDKCEYDVLDVIRAYFLAGREGEEFEGIITGVIEEGFFVELLDVYVEGMVRVVDLRDDYYRFVPESRVLVGKRLKKRFAIGDPVVVAVQAVHVAIGKVEFALVKGGGRLGRRKGEARGAS